jgi:hypothetical protein
MSRIGKIARLFTSDKARVDRLIKLYIHHRNLYSKGNGEIGSIVAIVNFQSAMVTWLFLRSIFPSLPLWVLAVGFVVAVVGRTVLKWYVGYIWDRKRIFDFEADWGNERNPAIKFIQTVLTKE